MLFDEFVGKMCFGTKPQGFYCQTDVAQYKTQKQLADSVSEGTSCMYFDVFMSCTNEIQQVIQVYEAQYLFPKL